MKKLIVVVLLCLSAMGMAQELSKDAVIEIGVVGTAKNFRIRTYFGPDQQNPAQDITWERLGGNRVAFVVVPTQEYMVSKEGFKVNKIKLSPKDPLFSTYGSSFSNYNELEQWAEDSLGESDGGVPGSGATSFSELTGTILNDQLTEEGIRAFESTFLIDASQVSNLPNSSTVPLTSLSSSSSLINKLKYSKNTTSVQLTGDSTGNADFEWFILGFEQFMSVEFPDVQIVQAPWGYPNPWYEDYNIINTGTTGIEPFVQMDYTLNQSGNVNARENGALDFTEDLDIAVKFSLQDITNMAEGIVMSNFQGNGTGRSWAVIVNNSGAMDIWWSNDGTTLTGNGASSRADANVSLAIDQTMYLRWTLDVDNGAGGHDLKYYQSMDDGESWVQIGNTITRSGTTTVHPNQKNWIINGRGNAALSMKFYKAIVRDGIDGKVIASPASFLMLEEVVIGLQKYYDMQGNQLSFNGNMTELRQGPKSLLLVNASSSGMALPYSADPAVFDVQNVKPSELYFISYSLNAGGDPDYLNKYPEFIESVQALHPNTLVVPVMQTPNFNVDQNIRDLHMERVLKVGQIATAKRLPYLNVYHAFINTGNARNYISEDNIHPNQLGNQLFADVLKDFLNGN